MVIPRIIASNSVVIFSGNHPISLGNNPYFSNLSLLGLKIASSDPETEYFLWCNNIILTYLQCKAIKCIFMYKKI